MNTDNNSVFFKVKIGKHTVLKTPFKCRALKEFNRLKSSLGKNFDIRLLNWQGEILRERPSLENISFLEEIGRDLKSKGERLKAWGEKQQYLEKIRESLYPQIEKLRAIENF